MLNKQRGSAKIKWDWKDTVDVIDVREIDQKMMKEDKEQEGQKEMTRW